MLRSKFILSAIIASSLLYVNTEVKAENLNEQNFISPQVEEIQIPSYKEIVDTVDVPTAEQLKAIAEKEKAIEQELSTFATIPEGIHRTIAVPSFKQQNSEYCGPATVKQVVHFLKGSSETQDTYADQLGYQKGAGTDFSNVDNILNRNQSKNTYAYVSIGTYDQWANKIKHAVVNNYPAVLDLRISPSYMPKYTTAVEGHILNVSGINTTATPFQVRLTDPFDQGGRGVTLGNVWHPHKGVYDANNAHFRKAMIY